MCKIPFRWMGGKARIAPWVCSLMCSHDAYVEPFAGSAAVLLFKAPSRHEIINDLNEDVVNFYRIIRNPRLADRLADMVSKTPYARHELNAHRARKVVPAPLERARQFLASCYMGFGANGRSFHFAIDQKYTTNWQNAPERILAVSRRMKNCIVESVDALELITRYDAPGTLLYLDPPYLHGTRSSSYRYKHEMDEAHHLEMIDRLNGLKHAKYLLSGYASPLYEEHLEYVKRYTQSARTHFNTEREEVIWCNYQPEAFLL